MKRQMDRMRRGVVAGALLMTLFAPLGFAQDEKSSAAQGAARSWLAMVDKMDVKASYDAADPKFRSSMTIERWDEAIKKIRAPLGPIDRRTVVSTRFTANLQGFPPGDYAVVVFRSAYALRPIQETVTLDRDSAGTWRVVGYSMT